MNGCNADKNPWKTSQPKNGTENIQKDGLHYTIYRRKKEILRSKIPNVKATDKPYQVWEADLTYIHCGIDGWGYLFNVCDIFTREWVGYCFDLSAVKENAIISLEMLL